MNRQGYSNKSYKQVRNTKTPGQKDSQPQGVASTYGKIHESNKRSNPNDQNNQHQNYQLNENANYGNKFFQPKGNFNPHMEGMNIGMEDQGNVPISSTTNQINFDQDTGGGENVMVAMRIRPMLPFEYNRGDEVCVKVIDDNNVQLMKNNNVKHFRFNRVISEQCSQVEAFHFCGISKLLDSALDGYAATLFAYGQTGSGKTYTMAGVEEKLGKEVYVSDDTEGIIPRSVRYLWQAMATRQENFYIKSSYMEIYNEQIHDLLNPTSGSLQCRWNLQNGFFVEDLMVVECTNVDDMLAVMNEGMRHRRIGCHELNKDSSRSHSILTIYLITEIITNGNAIRKYGKISFVDLAGSERLKETRSAGEMLTETKKINKSLFALGKVISNLSDKKTKDEYIPYRDSKLTMLLMDSLGGKAKALMISCVSPSGLYHDETLSTLNYATRTMNIKNKPVVQMDQKEGVIYNLTKENEQLKMENQFLKEQLERTRNGLPIDIPDYMHNNPRQQPPLNSSKRLPSGNKLESNEHQSLDMPYNKILMEYELELDRLKNENEETRNAKELAEKNYQILMNDNNAQNLKLENLENVFVGNPISKGNNTAEQRLLSEEYMTANLLQENTELKNNINRLEEKTMELNISLKEKSAGMNQIAKNIGDSMSQVNELMKMKSDNSDLQKRVEYLQMRERDLQDSLVKNKQKTSSKGTPKEHSQISGY